jgi:CDP-glucose 4,6-dehydratase
MTDWWSGRRVLVTGHTGFKGSWLTLRLLQRGAVVTGIALDPESDDGAFARLGPWTGLTDHRLDLTRDDLGPVVGGADPEVVFHLAGQALVSRGLADPVGTYAANVTGTVRLLEALRRLDRVPVGVVATTDKVYCNDRSGRRFDEREPLGGEDPYSTSKACADLLVRQWRMTGGVGHRLSAVRCGNVIGGGDRSEGRIVPDIVRAARSGEPLRLRAPGASRPWVFVLDALEGYLRLAEALATSDRDIPALNLGPPPDAEELTVADLVARFSSAMGVTVSVVPGEAAVVEDVPLQLDSRLAGQLLGWQPRLGIEESIGWTAAWERAVADGADVREVAVGQCRTYEGLGW